MLDTVRKSAVTVAALGAIGLGAAAIAPAASTTGSSSSSSSSSAQSRSQAQPPRMQREQLAAADAAKVRAAALAKVAGATVLRTEAGGPYATPYHAHIRTSGGTLQVVTVDASFDAVAVQADQGRGGRKGGPGGRGGKGGGHGETALTGTTKEKVEAAVLARYPGAKIERTETNRDSSAPYESHITTAGGKQLEVTVSRAFEVVAANEHP